MKRWILTLFCVSVFALHATFPTPFGTGGLLPTPQYVEAQAGAVAKGVGAVTGATKATKPAGATRSGAGSMLGGLGNILKDYKILIFTVLLVFGGLKALGIFFLQMSGSVFDVALNSTVSSFGNLPLLGYSLLTKFDELWTVFRDIANILILFTFIFIALATILNSHTYHMKTLAGRVILVAILLNFSLFFCKATIDVSNFFAYQFYQSISGVATQNMAAQNDPAKQKYCDDLAADLRSTWRAVDDTVAGTVNFAFSWFFFIDVPAETGRQKVERELRDKCGFTMEGSQKVGIAARFLDALALTKIYNGENKDEPSILDGMFSHLIFYMVRNTLGFFAVIGVTALFLYGGALLLIRLITLVLLSTISPLAFIAATLPKYKSYFDDWAKQFAKSAAFAPLFIILLWAILQIINGFGIGGSLKTNTADILTPSGGNAVIIGAFVINYIIILGLLYGAIRLANYISSQADGALFGASGLMRGWLNHGAGTVLGSPFRIAARGRDARIERENNNVKDAEKHLRGLALNGGSDADIKKAQEKLAAAKKRLEQKGDFRADSTLAQKLQKMGVNMGTAASKSMKEDLEKAKKATKEIDDMRADATRNAENKIASEKRNAPLTAAEQKLADANERASQANAALVDAVNKERVVPGDATSKTGEELRGAIEGFTSELEKHRTAEATIKADLAKATQNNDLTKAAALKTALGAKSEEIRAVKEKITEQTALLKPLVDRVSASAEAAPILKQIKDTMDAVADASSEQLRVKKLDREYEAREKELRRLGQDSATINMRKALSRIPDLAASPDRLEYTVNRALKKSDVVAKEDRQASEDAYRAARATRVEPPKADDKK